MYSLVGWFNKLAGAKFYEPSWPLGIFIYVLFDIKIHQVGIFLILCKIGRYLVCLF